MNKKAENNLSTSRILKSKYNEKEKQKTIPLLNRPLQKVKLLDLCPEQKLKIGQLIKTLQTRKQQNQYLSQQFSQLLSKHKQTEEILQQNVALLQQKQRRQLELLAEIQRYNQKLRVKQQYVFQLENYISRKKEVLQTKPSAELGVQTETVQTIEVGTQMKKKKTKCKNCQVQVNIRNNSPGPFYKAHSKSFEKIMKGSLPAQNVLQKERSRIITTQRKYERSSIKRQSSPQVNDFQSQSSDSAQLLAQKWRQLKEKHQNVNPMCSSFGLKQFPHKSMDEQGQSQPRQKAIPKKMSKFEQYDQLQLNRLLKSKKFSAQKLIRQRDESSQKNSKGKMSPEVNYLKSPCFNNQQSSSYKIDQASPEDRDINFFQSDILEIAESLKV